MNLLTVGASIIATQSPQLAMAEEGEGGRPESLDIDNFLRTGGFRSSVLSLYVAVFSASLFLTRISGLLSPTSFSEQARKPFQWAYHHKQVKVNQLLESICGKCLTSTQGLRALILLILFKETYTF